MFKPWLPLAVLSGCLTFITGYPVTALAYWTNQEADLVVGQPNMTSSTANNGGQSASTLYFPEGIYCDGSRLYIADFSNNRVLIYNHIPTANHAAADVVVGQPDMTSNAPNNGGVNAKSLNGPTRVCSDGTRLFISDNGNNRVLIFNQIPTGINIPADAVIGQPNMTSNTANNGGLSGARLNQPQGIYSDGTRFCIADWNNHRVLIYNHIPTTDGAVADVVVGQPNMTSNTANNGNVQAYSLSYPASVYNDGTKVYVVDYGNNRVLIYNQVPTSNQAAASIVIGQPDMTHSGNRGVGSTQLCDPTDVIRAGNKLCIADHSNNRVLIYNTIPATNNAPADVVLGQPNMTSNTFNNGGIKASTISSARSISSDGTNLYVADFSNNRALIYHTPFYIRGITSNHAFSSSSVNVLITGSFSNNTPVIKLSNGVADVTASGVQVSSGNQISCTFNLQVFPGIFDLQITQDGVTKILPECFFVPNPMTQPVQWNIRDLGPTWIGTTPPSPGTIASIAMADIDRDGKQELVIANQDLKIYIVKKTSSWSITALPQEVEYFKRLVIADGDQNEYPEVYCGTSSQNIFQYAGPAWNKTLASAGVTINAMASGDGDNDGRDEIYLAGADGHVYQAKSCSGIWSTSDLGHGAQAMLAVAAGDGNGDGSMEVYAASQDRNIYPFSYSNGNWIQGSAISSASTDMETLLVCDGDGDGAPELYGANADGKIYQFKWSSNAWVMQAIPVSASPVYGLSIGDGDNDGKDELYAACGNGHLYRIIKTGGSWQNTDMGGAGTPLYALAIGAGENNNQFEVYALGQNGHIYQFQAASLATPTPATSTPLQGSFKIYNNQINPDHGDQALIRWSQPQAGPVTITIYNLMGDKAVSLVDNQTYSAGQYHEVTWNGRNSHGNAVGSGIYIVILQAGDYRERGKAAVIK